MQFLTQYDILSIDTQHTENVYVPCFLACMDQVRLERPIVAILLHVILTLNGILFFAF